MQRFGKIRAAQNGESLYRGIEGMAGIGWRSSELQTRTAHASASARAHLRNGDEASPSVDRRTHLREGSDGDGDGDGNSVSGEKPVRNESKCPSDDSTSSDDVASDSNASRTRGRQGVVRILLFWPNIIGYLRIALLLALLLYLPLSSPHPSNPPTLSPPFSLPSIAHVSAYPNAYASPFATHVMPVLLCALLYLLNMALDGVDGIVARRLRQVSAFGAILDVAVDNALRTAMWAAAVNSALLGVNGVGVSAAVLGMNSVGGTVLGMISMRMLQAAAIIIPCVEWLTFTCSHASTLGSGSGSAAHVRGVDTTAVADCTKGGDVVATQEQEQGVGEGLEHENVGEGVDQGAGLEERAKERSNWKEVWGGRSDTPLLVSLVMRNGFKTPVGVMAIAGLHFLPLWLFLRHNLLSFLTSLPHAYTQSQPPLHHLGMLALAALTSLPVGLTLGVGRLSCLFVELWVIGTHLFQILLTDVEAYSCK
ncbi:unnamed protein product [Closterium sp. Yama58-4]|nr:unnamed protein product [Closterium sp. Yama58-4]